MRGRLTVMLAAATVFAAGCARPASVADAGGAPGGTASSTGRVTTTVAQAVVTGYVRIYGGPMNPTTGQAAMTGAPTPGSQVTIVDAAGHRTSTTSDSTGRFSFRLPPGTYHLDCSGEARSLTLLPGKTFEQDCPLDVP